MRRWLVAGVALVAVLAGCGGGDGVSPPRTDAPASLRVTSPALHDGGTVPRRYTCSGAGDAPPLAWSRPPGPTRSLAVVVTDPDAPGGTYLHWLVYDLPAGTRALAAGRLPAGARQADNSGGSRGWTPPCPPSGTHRYRFTVYALDAADLGADPGHPQDVLDALGQRVLARGRLTARLAGD